MAAAAPNTSLYVKNLDNKIKKTELRRSLHSLFAVYGRILDVVATKAGSMSGQAFVVFESLASATAALRALHGFSFYDRPLSVEYARTKSKATIVHDLGHEALHDPKVLATTRKGGLDALAPGQGRVTYSSAQQKEGKKRARDEVEEEEDEEEEETEVKDKDGEADAKVPKIDNAPDDDEGEAMEMEDDEDDEPKVAEPPAAAEEETVAAEPSPAPARPAATEEEGEVLYCPALADDVTEELLSGLFSSKDGFVKVVVEEGEGEVPPRGRAKKTKSVQGKYAFVTFGTAAQAKAAKEELDNHQLAPKKPLYVYFAARS